MYHLKILTQRLQSKSDIAHCATERSYLAHAIAAHERLAKVEKLVLIRIYKNGL